MDLCHAMKYSCLLILRIMTERLFQVKKAEEVHDLFLSRHADLPLLGEEVPESELFYTTGRLIFPKNSSQTCTSLDTSSEIHHIRTEIRKLEETINQQRMKLDDVRNIVNYMRSTNNQ
uniref:Uncharacterized protein n=1 Tax=Lactuca sativa TaxID=4236 RepID=A0A9R1WAL4_LACSA|nr:hypothetical protein LSAT_V11C200072480 [Lactuca sativa]